MATPKTRPPERASNELFGVDDGSFHRVELRWQRWGRVALALFIIAGFLGLFGSGPLSRATIRSADGSVLVEYERFARAHSTTEVRLRVSTADALGDVLDLWIDQAFARAIELEQIIPQPKQSTADELRLEFEIPASSETVVPIVLRYQPQKLGMARASFGIATRPPIRFRQFVFP